MSFDISLLSNLSSPLSYQIQRMKIRPMMYSVYLSISIAIFGTINSLPTMKRHFFFFFQIGVISSTAWLESNLSWRGILILTEPKSFFEAQRSSRNPRSKVLHACLSTDTDTKEVRNRSHFFHRSTMTSQIHAYHVRQRYSR